MFLLTAQSSTASTTATETFTTLHLILIAVLIVLVIAAILWGVRQKSARTAGEGEKAERTDALLAHPQTETAVSPAPPPLGDSGLGAGAAMPELVVAKTKPAARVTKPAAAPAPVAEPAAKVVRKPKAAVPKPALEPAPVGTAPRAKPATLVASPGAYRLIDVKGLGPKAVPLLDAQGVPDLATLAALDPARAAQIDAGLGVLAGRMARDRWVEQAKLLTAGNVAEFEATYGKL